MSLKLKLECGNCGEEITFKELNEILNNYKQLTEEPKKEIKEEPE